MTAPRRILPKALPPPRYEYGGDEFVFVDLDEEMSFQANFKALAITQELRRRNLPGIVEICPGNASYLIRLNPDELHPNELIAELGVVTDDAGDRDDWVFETRIVDVPVLYDDPWTRETLMRFRHHHQDPAATDLEFVARINGFKTTDDFIAAHSRTPYLVTMVGFVPGTPWCLQMVQPELMLQVPKYIRPRTDTPERAVAHGGAFTCIYPVRGPGGYQLFGISAVPIFDPTQTLPDFAETLVLLRPGDILKFRLVDRAEFDAVRAEVDGGTFQFRKRPIRFATRDFFEDPDAYNEGLLTELYRD